jgi:hypothetical protein
MNVFVAEEFIQDLSAAQLKTLRRVLLKIDIWNFLSYFHSHPGISILIRLFSNGILMRRLDNSDMDDR